MGNDNFTDEERRNQESAVNKLLQMITESKSQEVIDGHRLLAKRFKDMYDNYISVGFSREEAFELLKLQISDMSSYIHDHHIK